MQQKKGVFITLEGGEGTGKTTQIELIKKYLEERKLRYVSTREPGGSLIAQSIRQVILNPSHTDMDYRVELMLYMSSRRQHLVDIVLPELEKGSVILCDRFSDSSRVYQGFARNLSLELVNEMNHFATDGLEPNLTILLDINPESGLKRIHSNNREVNRLDLEGLDFHHKVRDGYLKLATMHPERIKVVNADQTVEEVFSDIKSILDSYFN